MATLPRSPTTPSQRLRQSRQPRDGVAIAGLRGIDDGGDAGGNVAAADGSASASGQVGGLSGKGEVRGSEGARERGRKGRGGWASGHVRKAPLAGVHAVLTAGVPRAGSKVSVASLREQSPGDTGADGWGGYAPLIWRIPMLPVTRSQTHSGSNSLHQATPAGESYPERLHHQPPQSRGQPAKGAYSTG